MSHFNYALVVMASIFFVVMVSNFLRYANKKPFGRWPKVERTLVVLIFGSAVLGAAYWFGSREIASRRASQEENEAADRREKMQRQETQDAMEALITTNRAVRDWKRSLCTQNYTAPILTSELQNALVTKDDRPVLITGSLTDMRDQNGQYVLTLSSHLCRDARLRVELALSSEESRIVLARRSESMPYYAIAAQVRSVEKTDTASDNGDSIFVVRGRCSNLIFTGFDGFSIDMEESLANSHR
jgi:hypothetical protein